MMSSVKVQVIVLAAGSGQRLGHVLPKPLVPVLDKPLLIHTLLPFEKMEVVSSLILVIQDQWREAYQKNLDQFGITKVTHMIPGGAERSDSVREGLAVIDEDTQIILVHDIARPMIDCAMVHRVIEAVQEVGAATVGVPVKPTLKKVNQHGMVEETLDRSKIWEIQTPQGFRKEILQKAHESRAITTDDAALVEKMGTPVKVVMGGYENIKITTIEDVGHLIYLIENKKQ